MALKASERAALAKGNLPKKRRPRRKRPAKGQNPMPAKRNGAGRKRGQRRDRGGHLAARGGTRNVDMGRKTCTITESEYIGEIVSAAGTPSLFNALSLPINPGQASTFPWLSKQAAQWEHYRFTKLVFRFRREVSEFAVAGTTGKVILMADYDASDPLPVNKQEMEDTIPHADAMPCENITLVLDPKCLHPGGIKKYVRPGGLPGSSDIKTFDGGNFVYASQNIAAPGVSLGEIHVDYTVVFETPILTAGATAAPANNQVTLMQISLAASPTSGVAGILGNTGAVQWLTDISTPPTGGPLNITVGGGVFLLNTPGNYLIDFVASCAGNGATSLSALYSYSINGVVQIPNLLASVDTSLTNSATVVSFPVFLQSNGSTLLQFNNVITYSAGAPQTNAYCRFTLI